MNLTATPPHSNEMERAVLTTIILDSAKAWPLLCQHGLRADHFFVPANRLIFEAMQEFVSKRGPSRLDVLSLTDAMRQSGTGNHLPITLLIGEIAAEPAYGNPLGYFDAVQEMHRRREIIKAAQQAERDAIAGQQEAHEIATALQGRLFESVASPTGTAVMTNAEAVASFLDHADAALRGRQKRLPFFLPNVQRLFGGFRDGKVYFIGAAPGGGKSTILANQFTRWAQSGVPVALNSIEMDHEEFLGRILCEMADVSSFNIETGWDGDGTGGWRLDRVREYAASIVDAAGNNVLPLWIDARQMNADTFESWARFMVARYGARAIGLDYLQILQAPGRMAKNTRREQVIYVVEMLRRVAKDLNVPVVALAQITKAARGEDRPSPHDFKEASEIQDAAYAIMMLYRNAEKPTDQQALWLDIQKHRGGPVGRVAVRFVGNRQRFEDEVNVSTGDESL